MRTLSGERLLAVIESGAFDVEIVAITSLINRSTQRAFEMILIAEGEIIAWVGCWKRACSLTARVGAPRVWTDHTRVHTFPGRGMDDGFSVEFESQPKAKHLANLLQELDDAFESINIGAM